MAIDARGSSHEKVVFTIIRNGFKTVFIADPFLCDCEMEYDEIVTEEFELILSEDRYDELFSEITIGHEC